MGGGGEAEARGRETGLETVAIAYGKSDESLSKSGGEGEEAADEQSVSEAESEVLRS